MERELTGNERFRNSILIFWRGLTDYFEEDELRFYHDLCRGKNCLAEVGNSQEDHSVYSAWVAFEMVRYYDRDIEALEEMRRYLAGKADEEPDWKDDLRDTVSGLFGFSEKNRAAVAAAYYRDARDVVTEILKLRKGLTSYEGVSE